MSETPIEDYLDELLRRTRADARSTRRLLEEAAAHLYATAADLQADAMPPIDAEIEAVRRFGPVTPIASATTRLGCTALASRASHAAVRLLAWTLVVAGASGLFALVMVVSFGNQFVGSVDLIPFRGTSMATSAWGNVILRVTLGVLGVLALYRIRAVQRRAPGPPTPPTGLVDTVAAIGFTLATATFTIACVAQAVQKQPLDHRLSPERGTGDSRGERVPRQARRPNHPPRPRRRRVTPATESDNHAPFATERAVPGYARARSGARPDLDGVT